MNPVVFEDVQPEAPDAAPNFSVGGLVLFTKPPRCKQRLQEPVQVLIHARMKGVSQNKKNKSFGGENV